MDWFVKAFVRSSLLWLGIGVLLGVMMALAPGTLIYRPAHVHANLLGFVTMMIFGVGYHVLPRFAARRLHSPRIARVHVWVSNAGLAGMVTGFLLRPHRPVVAAPVLGFGALLSAAGSFMFIYNMWRSLDRSEAQLTRITQERKTA